MKCMGVSGAVQLIYWLLGVKGLRVEKETQLDATECFIAIIICSTCCGHSYAHHQELETILVLLPRMLCNAFVVGGRPLGVEQLAMCPG